MDKTKIISFANHKGGVGKTTSTANVGGMLSAKYGYKVLLIDMDAQANLTSSLTKGSFEQSVYHAMLGQCALPILHLSEHLDLVPASLQLAMADIELSTRISREFILSDLIKPIKDQYDYILIDCPPSLSLLTMNALTASTHIIVPLKAEVLPFIGLSMIGQFVGRIRHHLNADLVIAGVLITQWENTKITNQIEAGLRKCGTYHIFNTKIRKNITIAEAPLEQEDILRYAPKSNGSLDYQSFTTELQEYLKKS